MKLHNNVAALARVTGGITAAADLARKSGIVPGTVRIRALCTSVCSSSVSLCVVNVVATGCIAHVRFRA